MNTPFLIVIFVLLMVALALLPWAHRAWSERNGRADSTKTSPIPDEGSMLTDLEHQNRLTMVRTGRLKTTSLNPGQFTKGKNFKARDLVSNRLKDMREIQSILADMGEKSALDPCRCRSARLWTPCHRLRATAEDQGLSEGQDGFRPTQDADDDRDYLEIGLCGQLRQREVCPFGYLWASTVLANDINRESSPTV